MLPKIIDMKHYKTRKSKVVMAVEAVAPSVILVTETSQMSFLVFRKHRVLMVLVLLLNSLVLY